MAIKIIYKNKKPCPLFSEIREGTAFLFGGNLFIKLEEVFKVDEIEREIDCIHDLICSDNIESEKHNALKIGDYSLAYISENVEVQEVDIECVVTNKKEG